MTTIYEHMRPKHLLRHRQERYKEIKLSRKEKAQQIKSARLIPVWLGYWKGSEFIPLEVSCLYKEG